MEAVSHPAVDDIEQPLDPRFIDLQRLRNTIAAAVLTAMLAVLTMIVWAAIGRWLAGLLLVPVWLVLSGVLFWHLRRWPGIAYTYASYRLDNVGIEIRKGVYWRRVTSIPRSRVQHTDVSQGPLERRFGLGTLVIHTAGTMNANVSLAGLEYGTAQRIRTQLMPGTDRDAV